MICLPQMHVAPLYRLYSAKTHVFVSGMRGVAFISTGRGKAGHSEGEGEKKKTRENEGILKMVGAGARRGENRGAGRSKRKCGAGLGKSKNVRCGAKQWINRNFIRRKLRKLIFQWYFYDSCVFIGPESDHALHWLCLSLTHWLTHWLTPVKKTWLMWPWHVKMPTQNLLRLLLLLM